MNRLLIACLFISGLSANAQEEQYIIKDLKSEWLSYKNGEYSAFDFVAAGRIRSINLPISKNIFRGNRLFIESQKPFSLFLNGFLLNDQQTEVDISIDSLESLAVDQPINLSIYFAHPVQSKSVKTLVVTSRQAHSNSQEGPVLRNENGFRNFIVTATLALFIFFATILRLNPKQLYHYFSLFKLFSLRESDDNQAFNRITSSTNILFYIFLALLSGLVMILLLSELKSVYSIASRLHTVYFFEGLLLWLKVSGIILLFFFIKAFGVSILSILFGVSDLSGLQFLNFIRLLLLSMTLFAGLGIGYFILLGEGPGFYSFLYKAMIWLMTGWLILSFLKLKGQVHFSALQLFSYICATEIIPFLVVVKILYE